jgi:Ser/Thr protein kinase RdoA (MazF antagonist)
MSLLRHAPQFTAVQAETLAAEVYGIAGNATLLPSERDQNFLVATEREKFVLKIANALETRDLLEAQNEVLAHLNDRLAFCPKVVRTQSGESISRVPSATSAHFVRLVTFIEGEPLAKAKQTAGLLSDFGKCLGQLNRALSDFDHHALHRDFHWDLANGLRVISEYDVLGSNPLLRDQIDNYAALFKDRFEPRLSQLPRSVIHGDANDYNVIVEDERVVGLIDFGDMVYSYSVGELAVALAYIVLDTPDPLACATEVVGGYLSEASLNKDELELLWPLTLMRLCMSVCMAAFQQQQNPDNAYLDISQQSIRESLAQLLAISSEDVLKTLK